MRAVLAGGIQVARLQAADGEYRQRDLVLQQAGHIGFVAQVPGQTVFDGAACEGKAVIVARGR